MCNDAFCSLKPFAIAIATVMYSQLDIRISYYGLYLITFVILADIVSFAYNTIHKCLL